MNKASRNRATHEAQYIVLTAFEKEDFAGEVQYSLAEGKLAPMDGLQNVWYEGFSPGDDLLEVIVVGMSAPPK